jgi:hypothetical protein
MTATISRLYNNYADAQEAVRSLEAAGIAHSDINIIASNADNWYSSDRKPAKDTFPDRDLDGKDDRAEAAGAGAGVGAAGVEQAARRCATGIAVRLARIVRRETTRATTRPIFLPP